MSEIRFEEEQVVTQNMRDAQQEKKITVLGKLLIKLSGGRIKNQRQANKIFVIIIIMLCTYSAYLLITKILI